MSGSPKIFGMGYLQILENGGNRMIRDKFILKVFPNALSITTDQFRKRLWPFKDSGKLSDLEDPIDRKVIDHTWGKGPVILISD